MKYLALACDYDGTLACNGRVAGPTIKALERLKTAGWKLLLVTGRELDELLGLFTPATLFDRIIAENGALIYTPRANQRRLLCPELPDRFIDALRQEGVKPLSVGCVVAATRTPQELTVIKIIRQLGLELQVIFNKGAVMILPAGVNKATGLKAALAEINLAPRQVAGIGDAENDHAFLSLCGLSGVVADAVPALKDHAHWVASRTNGSGVVEFIENLLSHVIT